MFKAILALILIAFMIWILMPVGVFNILGEVIHKRIDKIKKIK